MKKNVKKKKKGFTLIELLAVIIILGILMIIAVPAVISYITDTRKSSYVDIAKSITQGARNFIHSGELDVADTNTSYYMDARCIKTDNDFKSPYGEFSKAYVVIVVSSDEKTHEYYWMSVDETGMGIKKIIEIDKLSENDIESNLSINDIATTKGINGRDKIVVIDFPNCEENSPVDAETQINVTTGEEIVVCKKATVLHTKTCERASNGCGAIIGNGNTITYGTIPTGELKAGDAYDCDVNNDGVYDSVTERFYYVTSDGNNAILIYYTNMNNQTKYMYDSVQENWHGPREAYKYLPSTSVWSNPNLILPGTRQIKNDNGGIITRTHTIESFTYESKAARFLNYDEVQSLTNNSIRRYNSLDSFYFLFENIGIFESDSGTRSYGYWTETPISATDDKIWGLVGSYRFVMDYTANSSASCGVRPAIIVKKSEIEK